MIRIERNADAMGSTFSIILYGENEARMERAVDAAFQEAARLDDLLSNYKPYSEWSEVNRHAARGPVAVTSELFRLLADCVEYSRLTDGAFDITVGPLMKAWGFYKADGFVHSPPELAEAHSRCGYGHLVLDALAQTVYFRVPGMELDPGGIGKGYAVDRMTATLREHGFDVALLAAARSSLYGLGAPPTEARGWPVKVGDDVIFLRDCALSTSGSLEKFFHKDGKTYCHLLNPLTGSPVEGAMSVSITAPQAVDTEAWTKPCLIHGHAWASGHLPPRFRAFCSSP